MATIIKLSKRVEYLGYKLGDIVEIIEEDYGCKLKLKYRCKSKRTYDLWFKSDEIRK